MRGPVRTGFVMSCESVIISKQTKKSVKKNEHLVGDWHKSRDGRVQQEKEAKDGQQLASE